MPRPLAALALLISGVAAGCGDDHEAPPPAPERETIVVETIYLGLATVSTSSYQRREAVRDVLSASESDVLCLTGIWDASARPVIVDALGDAFAFWTELPTNDDTPVDDPSREDGSIPDVPVTPPCTPSQSDALDTVVECLRTQCSDGQRDLGSFGPPCVAAGLGICTAKLDALPRFDDPSQRCRACIAAHVRTGDVIDEMRDRCTELVGDPLARRGDSGLLVLSKLPIEAVDLYVMPAQSLRRAAITVEVRSEAGRAVDVTCTSLGPTMAKGIPYDPSTDDPYPGPYGGWVEEHDLQLDKLLSHLEPRRASRPGILLGAWGDSPSRTEGGVTLLRGSGEASVERMRTEMVEAVPEGFDTSCTLCPQNRVFSAPFLPEPSWPNRVYLDGLDDAIVSSATRTYVGNVVATNVDDSGFLPASVPLPLVYGFRASLELPLP